MALWDIIHTVPSVDANSIVFVIKNIPSPSREYIFRKPSSIPSKSFNFLRILKIITNLWDTM